LFYVLFLVMYIVVSFLFVYKFSDHCHRVKTQFLLIDVIYNITYLTIQWVEVQLCLVPAS
jgi:hypothetical protein